MSAIDRRVLTAGLGITVAELLHVWAEHCPAHLPIPDSCPGCGHDYATGPLCPTARLIRPMLQRRRHETTPDKLLQTLTYNQYRDLLDKHLSTETAFSTRAAGHHDQTPPATTPGTQTGLFDVLPYRQGGTR